MKTRLRIATLAAIFACLAPNLPTLHAQVLAAAEGVDVPDGTRKAIKPNKRIPKGGDPRTPLACLAPVVNASATSDNEAESFVVVNPTNTNNLVAFANLTTTNSIFRAYSTNGGATWTRGTVATNVACCDAQAAWDTFGNLFVVYINSSVNQINVILSTDGGVTFSAPVTVGTGSVDQPSIAVGNGSVWVDWNSSGSMVARGAPVTGLGVWGPFNALQSIPSASGSFGGIAVGPGPNGGKVIVTYQNPTGGQGPATIFANVDADGLGAGAFGARITVTTTNVGGFDFIPAQSGRSIDSEAGMVWDGTGGPFNNRIYLVYTEETVNENNDTEIYVRTSIDDGATWSAPVRVNDDPLGPIRSQFLPYITLDRTTGTVAVGFYDARNDNGVAGTGGTNATANDDAEYFGTFSTDGGVTWAPNTRLSGGFSNAAAADNGVDYGDYVGHAAHAGKLYSLWADNANCDGTNANGTLHAFDLYTNSLVLPGGGLSVTSSVPACNSVVNAQTVNFVINLTAAVNTSTVQAGDFTVNGTPSNVAPTFSNGNTTITFHFSSTPVVAGSNTMHIAAGAFSDTTARPVADFTCTFCYVATQLTVSSTNPAVNGTFSPAAPGDYTYDVTWNQPVDPASVQTGDLTVTGTAGGSVTAVQVINGNLTTRFTVHFNSGGSATSSITAAAITAQGCNGNVAFTGSYTVAGCPPQQYVISSGADPIVAGTTDIGSHCDDCDTAVTLPFPITLYGNTYNSVNVSSNGRLDFVVANENGGHVTACLPAPPNQGPYDNTIFPIWQDMRTEAGLSGCAGFPGGQCGVFTSVSGTAPNRILNIEWRTVLFANNASRQNFEARLYENNQNLNQRFDVIIGSLTATGANRNYVSGVQGATGFSTQDFCVSTAPVQNVSRSYTISPCNQPTVSTVASRKTHGAAGSFDIPLPLTGTPGIECRVGGATNDYTMAVGFTGNVTVTGSPQAQVTLGAGCVGTGGVCAGGNNVAVSGATVTIPLTNITNAQTINVTLLGVSNGSGLTNVVIPMSRLLGDTTAAGGVTASDINQTKSQSGLAISAANFRTDLSANGAINAADISIVKAQSGTQLPP